MATPTVNILDTNVIVRYLMGDVAAHQAQAMIWFKEAEAGKRIIVLSPLVLAEACFVLESVYGLSHEQVASLLEPFMAQEWLYLEEKRACAHLWGNYRQGLHFVDSYLVSRAYINSFAVLTFDRKMQKRS